MPKEINLFEQETETTEPAEAEKPIETAKPPKPAYKQYSLPGLDDVQPAKASFDIQPSQPGLDVQTRFHLKRTIEALLFASSEPLNFNKIREITEPIHPLQPRVLKAIIQELKEEYVAQQRAFRLEEIAQGFVLRTCEQYSPFIELIGRNKRGEKLSHAAAEVLAIIAYRQPITRSQIESIRGVDSSGTLASLLERQLIEPQGKLEAPGRPTLYGITKEFLKYFGLRDLTELPSLEKSRG
jgi:segregation and condensation protein B